GLVRSAQTEHPDRIILLDLDPAPDKAPADLGAVLAAIGDEPQVALRDGVLFGTRLVRTAASAPDHEGAQPGQARPWDRDGALLITGGAGFRGGVVAGLLVRGQGVGGVVGVSRSGAAGAGVLGLVAELAGLGARVRVVAGDVADRGVLAGVVGGVPGRWP